jgi:hypothetical protein
MYLASNSHTKQSEQVQSKSLAASHVQTVFQNTNPNEIHNILATSQIATHLFSRATVITQSTFSCFAHQWIPKHSTSSTEATLTSNFDNHSKTCVLPTVCSPHANVNILKVSVALSPVESKILHRCTVVSGLPFYKYAEIANGTTYTYITRHYSTITHATAIGQTGNASEDPPLSKPSGRTL